jgi:hypothetical protein
MIALVILMSGYLALITTISLVAVFHGEEIRRSDARRVLMILLIPRRPKSDDSRGPSPTTQTSGSPTD